LVDLLFRTGKEAKCKYGNAPEERSLEELLKWGVINLDKPAGPTSHQVVAWVKQILGIKKAGHGGTLDPNVTGVLPTAVGRATKAIKVMHIGSKEYVGVMILHRDVPKSKFKKVFKEFKGELYQLPPVRSAVKRVLRTRVVFDSKVIEMKGRRVLFRIESEAGTYIRTFCHDIGEALGVGAHMAQLRRTRTGAFLEKDAMTMHQLKDGFVYWQEYEEEEALRKVVLPFERLFDHIPKVYVKDQAGSAVSHGAPLAAVGIVKVTPDIKEGETVVVLTGNGEAISIGRAIMASERMVKDTKGVAVETERVLKDEIFPKLWKKGKRTKD